MSNLPTPITRKEQFLNSIARGNTGDLPTPITREEEYLDAIAKSGGGGSGDGDMKKSVYDSDLAVSEAGGIKAFVSNAVSGKVDKVEGKGLSTNDYSDTEKGKVAGNTAAIGALSDTMAVNGAHNLAFSETSGSVIANLKSGVSYIMSFTGGGTVDLTKDTASGTAIATGASSPITITPNRDYGVYMVTSGTVNNILIKLATDPSTEYTPYAMTNEQLTERKADKTWAYLDTIMEGTNDANIVIPDSASEVLLIGGPNNFQYNNASIVIPTDFLLYNPLKIKTGVPECGNGQGTDVEATFNYKKLYSCSTKFYNQQTGQWQAGLGTGGLKVYYR